MNIQNKHKTTPKRILDDPNPALWKESEEGQEKNIEFIQQLSEARVKYLARQLITLRKKYNSNPENEAEYYKLRDELVILCQRGYLGLGLKLEDKGWVNYGLNCLLSLYDSLIKRIANNYILKRKAQSSSINLDLDEVTGYARQLFTRLITGDTPWAIQTFMDQEDDTQETKAALTEIDVHKKKRASVENLNSYEQFLDHPDDKKLTRWIMQMQVEQIPDWLNQRPLKYKDWLRRRLADEARRR